MSAGADWDIFLLVGNSAGMINDVPLREIVRDDRAFRRLLAHGGMRGLGRSGRSCFGVRSLLATIMKSALSRRRKVMVTDRFMTGLDFEKWILVRLSHTSKILSKPAHPRSPRPDIRG
jgi:hypothetical protein